MAWNDTPPTQQELGATAPSNDWTSTPPTQQELAASSSNDPVANLISSGYDANKFNALTPDQQKQYNSLKNEEATNASAAIGRNLEKGAGLPFRLLGLDPAAMSASLEKNVIAPIGDAITGNDTSELYANKTPEQLQNTYNQQIQQASDKSPGAAMIGNAIGSAPTYALGGSLAGAAAEGVGALANASPLAQSALNVAGQTASNTAVAGGQGYTDNPYATQDQKVQAAKTAALLGGGLGLAGSLVGEVPSALSALGKDSSNKLLANAALGAEGVNTATAAGRQAITQQGEELAAQTAQGVSNLNNTLGKQAASEIQDSFQSTAKDAQTSVEDIVNKITNNLDVIGKTSGQDAMDTINSSFADALKQTGEQLELTGTKLTTFIQDGLDKYGPVIKSELAKASESGVTIPAEKNFLRTFLAIKNAKVSLNEANNVQDKLWSNWADTLYDVSENTVKQKNTTFGAPGDEGSFTTSNTQVQGEGQAPAQLPNPSEQPNLLAKQVASGEINMAPANASQIPNTATEGPSATNYNYDVTEGIGKQKVTAIDKNGNVVGKVLFKNKSDLDGNNWLEAEQADVKPEFQKQGIATEMYKQMADRGYEIRPSDDVSDEGKALWDSLNRKGIGKLPADNDFLSNQNSAPATQTPAPNEPGVDSPLTLSTIKSAQREAGQVGSTPTSGQSITQVNQTFTPKTQVPIAEAKQMANALGNAAGNPNLEEIQPLAADLARQLRNSISQKAGTAYTDASKSYSNLKSAMEAMGIPKIQSAAITGDNITPEGVTAFIKKAAQMDAQGDTAALDRVYGHLNEVDPQFAAGFKSEVDKVSDQISSIRKAQNAPVDTKAQVLQDQGLATPAVNQAQQTLQNINQVQKQVGSNFPQIRKFVNDINPSDIGSQADLQRTLATLDQIDPESASILRSKAAQSAVSKNNTLSAAANKSPLDQANALQNVSDIGPLKSTKAAQDLENLNVINKNIGSTTDLGMPSDTTRDFIKNYGISKDTPSGSATRSDIDAIVQKLASYDPTLAAAVETQAPVIGRQLRAIDYGQSGSALGSPVTKALGGAGAMAYKGANVVGQLSRGAAGLADALTNPAAAGGASLVSGSVANSQQAKQNAASNKSDSPFAATSLNQLSSLIQSSPQVLGKYAAPLQSANERGINALAAQHFALYQNDPEYRAIVNPLQAASEKQSNGY